MASKAFDSNSSGKKRFVGTEIDGRSRLALGAYRVKLAPIAAWSPRQQGILPDVAETWAAKLPIELVFPGHQLSLENEDQRIRLHALIRLASGCFVAADVSLQMFEEAQRSNPVHLPAELSHEAEMVATRRARPDLRTMKNPSAIRESTLRVARQFKRDRWQAGVVPTSYQIQRALISARAFLFACDGVYKALGKMLTEDGAPHRLKEIQADFDLQLPSLKAIRDSAHHYEDRVVGERRPGKPLLVPSTGTLPIVADTLLGSQYAATLADGTIGSLEVTTASLLKLQMLVQRVIDAFEWHLSGMGPIYEP